MILPGDRPTVAAPPGMLDMCSPAAVDIARTLRQHGHHALFAGGCVRDMLMGKAPADFDIATSATPDEVEHLFPATHQVGKAFGVVLVHVGDVSYEVATFRRESGYEDGRHPRVVEFTDERSDASRRDFTINALFYSPLENTIIDHTGGLSDLTAGVIRAVGNAQSRFSEDHLRMLRAVRFQASLGFVLDAGTADAIRLNAASITRISVERIRDELLRILGESIRPGDAVLLLKQLDLLAHILPEVARMDGQDQPADVHPEGDVFAHTIAMLNLMECPRDPLLAFAVLLHDIGKPLTSEVHEGRLRFPGHAEKGALAAEALMRRLNFSNADREAACAMVGNHMKYVHALSLRESTMRRLMASATFERELELHRLDLLSSASSLATYDFVMAKKRECGTSTTLPAPWITGHDIMSMGRRQGPEVGALLEGAYNLQLEGAFKDREELLTWVRGQVAAEGRTTGDT